MLKCKTITPFLRLKAHFARFTSLWWQTGILQMHGQLLCEIHIYGTNKKKNTFLKLDGLEEEKEKKNNTFINPTVGQFAQSQQK